MYAAFALLKADDYGFSDPNRNVRLPRHYFPQGSLRSRSFHQSSTIRGCASGLERPCMLWSIDLIHHFPNRDDHISSIHHFQHEYVNSITYVGHGHGQLPNFIAMNNRILY